MGSEVKLRGWQELLEQGLMRVEFGGLVQYRDVSVLLSQKLEDGIRGL